MACGASSTDTGNSFRAFSADRSFGDAVAASTKARQQG
jgi:hypothetical protein